MVTLESIRLFNQLKPEALSALRQLAREQKFAAGEEIFKEGGAGDGVYVVKDGLVEISVMVSPGMRQVFSQIQPGEIFGEMAVIEDKPRSACAMARSATEVYFIPRDGMLRLLDQSPALSQALLREVSHRLREFNHQYLREVVQAERLAIVGRFARAIVHDLKNPLNIIGLTAEIAGLEDGSAEMRKQAVTGIREQVERINEMIGEILDFTQGAAPEMVLPPADYGMYVTQVVEELQREAALREVIIECPPVPAGAEVTLHPKRLRRVFANLVHNATDAMPAGGKITLRFELKPKEIVTEIEDTGPGLPTEMQGRLFEAFATYGKTHGTGLGLSICKRIVEDHKGWIAARSEPGRGAIFAFGLPLNQPATGQ